jgi:hypothetical protein
MRAFAFVCVLAQALMAQTPSREPARLKVAEGNRFLVTADGRPFFYLGDTAWELFHRLNREEATRYRSFRRWRLPNSTG